MTQDNIQAVGYFEQGNPKHDGSDAYELGHHQMSCVRTKTYFPISYPDNVARCRGFDINDSQDISARAAWQRLGVCFAPIAIETITDGVAMSRGCRKEGIRPRVLKINAVGIVGDYGKLSWPVPCDYGCGLNQSTLSTAKKSRTVRVACRKVLMRRQMRRKMGFEGSRSNTQPHARTVQNYLGTGECLGDVVLRRGTSHRVKISTGAPSNLGRPSAKWAGVTLVKHKTAGVSPTLFASMGPSLNYWVNVVSASQSYNGLARYERRQYAQTSKQTVDNSRR